MTTLNTVYLSDVSAFCTRMRLINQSREGKILALYATGFILDADLADPDSLDSLHVEATALVALRNGEQEQQWRFAASDALGEADTRRPVAKAMANAVGELADMLQQLQRDLGVQLHPGRIGEPILPEHNLFRLPNFPP